MFIFGACDTLKRLDRVHVVWCGGHLRSEGECVNDGDHQGEKRVLNRMSMCRVNQFVVMFFFVFFFGWKNQWAQPGRETT